MSLPSSDPAALHTQLKSIIGGISDDNTTQQLVGSLEQLTAILTSHSQGHALDSKEITEIGEYGMQILASCAKYAREANNTELQQTIGMMAVSISLWVSDHEGRVTSLEQVADTLAWLANHTQDQDELVTLSGIIGKIINTCSLDISSDLENTNPGRPWRVININRGIVATRSHDPEIMEAAFQTLIKNLPKDAPNFFAEGMSEVERLGYPNHVRKVMERYYEQWNEPHVIH